MKTSLKGGTKCHEKINKYIKGQNVKDIKVYLKINNEIFPM